MYPCSSDKSVCNISYTSFRKCSCREGNINFFLIVYGLFKVYGRCREVTTLFVFLMSPYNLLETCNIVQNRTFHQPAKMGRWANLLIILEGHGITNSGNLYLNRSIQMFIWELYKRSYQTNLLPVCIYLLPLALHDAQVELCQGHITFSH